MAVRERVIAGTTPREEVAGICGRKHAKGVWMRFPGHVVTAEFVSRSNRFVVECLLGGLHVRAYLPNPGRLWELLVPGRKVYLARTEEPGRRFPYSCVAVQRWGAPVMLDTHHANDVAKSILQRQLVPDLRGYRVVREEVTFGSSRFDFLLERGGQELVLEVKSCTLFGREIAMFPDAITERGARHVAELRSLSGRGRKAGILFIVHWPRARYFLPEYHTDLHFARTLIDARQDIIVKAVSVRWLPDMSASYEGEVSIPWEIAEREAKDRGAYVVILHLPASVRVDVGALSTVEFPRGYYLYVGSAARNLSQRIDRHRRVRKRLHWHIDYLRQHSLFVRAIPVRSSEMLECELAGAIGNMAQWAVSGFGSSDCACDTHLFGMSVDPTTHPEFISCMQRFRIDRLAERLGAGVAGREGVCGEQSG